MKVKWSFKKTECGEPSAVRIVTIDKNRRLERIALRLERKIDELSKRKRFFMHILEAEFRIRESNDSRKISILHEIGHVYFQEYLKRKNVNHCYAADRLLEEIAAWLFAFNMSSNKGTEAIKDARYARMCLRSYCSYYSNEESTFVIDYSIDGEISIVERTIYEDGVRIAEMVAAKVVGNEVMLAMSVENRLDGGECIRIKFEKDSPIDLLKYGID